MRYRSNFQCVVEVGQEGPQYEDIVIMAAPGSKYNLQDSWILTVGIGSQTGLKTLNILQYTERIFHRCPEHRSCQNFII